MGHKYKNKYVSIKDIYKTVKGSINKYYLYCKIRKTKANRVVSYQVYYSIIKRFFEILVRDVVERNYKVELPGGMGYKSISRARRQYCNTRARRNCFLQGAYFRRLL